MNKYFNSRSYIHYKNYGIREDREVMIDDDPRDDSHDDYSNVICYCNPKNTKLDELILCFSYLLTDCYKCARNYGDDNDNENEFDGNTESTYQECNTLIVKNPELVFTKNKFGLYPLELVELLDQTFMRCYDSYKYMNGFPKLSYNYLCMIRKDLLRVYIKYEFIKSVAFRYIRLSNHIGKDTSKYQLPYELWEHIFTFI